MGENLAAAPHQPQVFCVIFFPFFHPKQPSVNPQPCRRWFRCCLSFGRSPKVFRDGCATRSNSGAGDARARAGGDLAPGHERLRRKSVKWTKCKSAPPGGSPGAGFKTNYLKPGQTRLPASNQQRRSPARGRGRPRTGRPAARGALGMANTTLQGWSRTFRGWGGGGGGGRR